MTAREIQSKISKTLETHLEELTFSEPLKMQQFERFAWLTFDTEEATTAALDQLNGITVKVPSEFEQQNLKDYTMEPVRSSQPNKKPKVTPAMPDGHIQEHLALCKRLIQDVFDVEHLIEFPMAKLNTLGSDRQRLDFLLLYMRRVHGFCLYCGIHCPNERQLAVKCSVQHLRQTKTVPKKDFDNLSFYHENRVFYANISKKANEIL
jgi:hypothetical protein